MFFVILFEYIVLIFFSYILRQNKNINWFWIISSIIFAATLTMYNPNSSMDLFRYNLSLNEYRRNNLNDITNQYYFKYSPLYPLYFYFISRFSSNRMLMLVTSGLAYFIVFKMLTDAKKTMKLTAKGQFWCFLIILLFIDMLNLTGVRSMLGTIIATAAFFQDINNRKKSAIVLYIIGGLLHASVWVVAVMRLASVLLKRLFTNVYTLGIIIVLTYASMTGLLAFPQLILKIYNNTGIRFFYALGWQLISYTERGDSTANTVILYYIATLLRMIAMMIAFRCSHYATDKKYYGYCYIPASIIAFAIGIIGIPSASVRFFIIANVLSIPLMWKFFNPLAETGIRVNGSQNIGFNTYEYKRNNILTYIILGSFLVQFIYLFYYQYSQFGYSLDFCRNIMKVITDEINIEVLI